MQDQLLKLLSVRDEDIATFLREHVSPEDREITVEIWAGMSLGWLHLAFAAVFALLPWGLAQGWLGFTVPASKLTVISIIALAGVAYNGYLHTVSLSRRRWALAWLARRDNA